MTKSDMVGIFSMEPESSHSAPPLRYAPVNAQNQPVPAPGQSGRYHVPPTSAAPVAAPASTQAQQSQMQQQWYEYQQQQMYYYQYAQYYNQQAGSLPQGQTQVPQPQDQQQNYGQMQQHQRPPKNKRPRPNTPVNPALYCSNCDKSFARAETMATHRLAHKRCSQCGFEAIAKVLAMHMDEAHAPKYAQVSGTLDSPEEIAAWVAARKQAYPKEDSKQIDESPKTTKGKCKFFSKGTCKKGSNCSFSHEGMTAPFSLQNTPKQEPLSVTQLVAKQDVIMEAIKYIVAHNFFKTADADNGK